MSDAVLIALSTAFASVVSIIISQLVAGWISKRKTEAETGKINSDRDLSKGDLVQKYQKIATDQADENIELSDKLKTQEAEKIELLTSMKSLREEMLLLDSSHKIEIAELKASFEIERKENEKWRDWASRLVLQLESWKIIPVPFSPEEAKAKMLNMGDMGSYVPKGGDI